MTPEEFDEAMDKGEPVEVEVDIRPDLPATEKDIVSSVANEAIDIFGEERLRTIRAVAPFHVREAIDTLLQYRTEKKPKPTYRHPVGVTKTGKIAWDHSEPIITNVNLPIAMTNFYVAEVEVDFVVEGRVMDRLVNPSGQTLWVHNWEECSDHACCIHSPSDHAMKDWPKVFRLDRNFMERMCKHGVGHPDPDDLEYWWHQGKDISVHGCDGCCGGQAQVQALQREPGEEEVELPERGAGLADDRQDPQE